MRLPERRQRTHTLTLEVPMHLDPDAPFDYNAVEETLRVVVAVSRLACDGAVCDDLTVRLDPVEG